MILFVVGLAAWDGAVPAVTATESSPGPSDDSTKLWHILIAQAESGGLPVGFLKEIAPGFVTIEFDDLHAYAAEYHPEEHRMVFNLTLSFNGAGGILKPLARLTTRELGTLYHELFHAYVDYISSLPTGDTGGPRAARLMAFAREQQRCRYGQVKITPIPQRKTRTEIRVLTERESWEALNETWAVFIGWTIWTNLEIRSGGTAQSRQPLRADGKAWLKRLKKADQDGDLVGYYEPEDEAERALARKRYLAPSQSISRSEAGVLLETVLEYPLEEVRRSTAAMAHRSSASPGGTVCR